MARCYQYNATADDLVKFDAGVHHGVLLFGFVMLLRGVAEALEAFSRAHKELK
jgi:hypothetical protein